MLIKTSTINRPHEPKRLDEVDTHKTYNLYLMCRTTINFDNVMLFNCSLLAAFLRSIATEKAAFQSTRACRAILTLPLTLTCKTLYCTRYRLQVQRYSHDWVNWLTETEGVGKVQGAGAGWTGGKVRSPECRVPCTFPNRAAPLVKCRFGIPHKSAG